MPDNEWDPLGGALYTQGSFPPPDPENDPSRLKPAPKRPADFPTEPLKAPLKMPENPPDNLFDYVLPMGSLKALMFGGNPISLLSDLADKDVTDEFLRSGQWYGSFGNIDSSLPGEAVDWVTKDPSWYNATAHPNLHDGEGFEKITDFLTKKAYQSNLENEMVQESRAAAEEQKKAEAKAADDEAYERKYSNPRHGSTRLSPIRSEEDVETTKQKLEEDDEWLRSRNQPALTHRNRKRYNW